MTMGQHDEQLAADYLRGRQKPAISLRVLRLGVALLLAFIAAVVVWIFAGCTSTGEFDSQGFAAGTRAVTDAYTVYDRSQHPERYPAYPPTPPPPR